MGRLAFVKRSFTRGALAGTLNKAPGYEAGGALRRSVGQSCFVLVGVDIGAGVGGTPVICAARNRRGQAPAAQQRRHTNSYCGSDL